jgi:RsiW-degrading membrane proteinase PrsW (M82 family)
MGILLSLFFGFAPMFLFAAFVYWLDRYEKEPKLLLGVVFFWGAVIAAGAAFLINTVLGMGIYLFTGSETATDLTTASLIAPIVEESFKGIAVLIVFLVFHSEFDSLLDGFVYAAVVALGFAATENAYYIYQYGFAEGGISGLMGMVFVRVILVGWQHPFYTAFTGVGLALARLNRSTLVKVIAPTAGWGLAVFTHSVHNTLASLLNGSEGLVFGTIVDWTGWFFMFLVILWAIYRDKTAIRKYLQEEVSLGLITPLQYKTACSAWAMNQARLGALLSGHYRATDRFYQTCAELAHKKNQLSRIGDEKGNQATIERLRAELGRLSIQAGN